MMVLEDRQSLVDDEVIRRVLAGETQLYELLMRRYNQRVFRVIRSVLTDDLEAEDVLQDTWVRAFEHLRQFEARAAFATWVTKIGLYEARGRIRKSKRLTTLPDDYGESMSETQNGPVRADNPEKQAMRGELGIALRSAVDALPESYRLVFMLREVEELSTTETAECLSLSEEAVKTRLHRSRAMLRHALQPRIGTVIAQAYAFLGSRCDRTVAGVLARLEANPRSALR
jgi:RNA polymerase sigma-70 factor, ECF subfamily